MKKRKHTPLKMMQSKKHKVTVLIVDDAVAETLLEGKLLEKRATGLHPTLAGMVLASRLMAHNARYADLLDQFVQAQIQQDGDMARFTGFAVLERAVLQGDLTAFMRTPSEEL